MSTVGAVRPTGARTSASDDRIREVVYRSCLLLDAERFDDYIALFAPGARYRITSWSPDIRRDLVLLDHDRETYAAMLSNVRHHERMLGTFSRHLTGQLIERDEEGRVGVTSSLLVMYTDIEGVSRVFAVGRYLDRFDVSGPQPLIASREVRLETRELGPGSHVPM